MLLTGRERMLCQNLRDLPKEHGYRFTQSASQALQQILFASLVAQNEDYLRILFNGNLPKPGQDWILRRAQGFIEGSEYSDAARGKACGHIFKNGDAVYRCKTCTSDDTCVLCTRCFEGSDHAGHTVTQTVSSGNSGCCDCGDDEAWRVPVKCAIHTLDRLTASGKEKQEPRLPDDLLESLRMTIGRTLDYLCDVLSCSPENLRLDKQAGEIKQDEQDSYLTSHWYDEAEDHDPEFALMLWNDEKHTVQEVTDQVARACKKAKSFGEEKANETNDFGRSVIEYSRDLNRLMRIAKIIEQIKITVTIRSSRDTFREQMCNTMIEWLEDVAGCSVGDEHTILQQTVCEELLKPWRAGCGANNKWPGGKGLDDHEVDESAEYSRTVRSAALRRGALTRGFGFRMIADESDDSDPFPNDNDNDDGDDEAESQMNDDDDRTGRTLFNTFTVVGVRGEDREMRSPGDLEDETEVLEATQAGYPPPPPPPPPAPLQQPQHHGPVRTYSSTSEIGEGPSHTPSAPALPNAEVPKTPWLYKKKKKEAPPSYWLEKPQDPANKEPLSLHEDLHQRVRLDFLMLYDLRLWKRARIGLRDLYISTVVSVPQFKRILGLRFAGLYTWLAQLYLIADREPDNAVINLSVQMLTTPSIVQETVQKANFLTKLIAILYTFLTERQVGHPRDVGIHQTLAFDAGSVANRRMYFFFHDLKRLFENPFVQEQLRSQERYQLQFLDLIRLPQGICPNIRAVGDHVEYENDVWIGASLMTKEMNKLCRQFAESFEWHGREESFELKRTLRLMAQATIINSLGVERHRFDLAEIKNATHFKTLEPFTFEHSHSEATTGHSVVSFVVEAEPISFHHALHYTLSWLIDVGRNMSVGHLRSLLSFTAQDLKGAHLNTQSVPDHDPESYLLALFDFPLRVCAWLAQMKAGMWVRNGLSLRHQMGTYRGVANRDFGHHRDIFLLQTAMVICEPSRVLASIVDRFSMNDWVRGRYITQSGFEPSQQLDVAEDFVHLLIVLLSDRTSLLPAERGCNPQELALRRDIAHILCFRPLSFSDINSRLGLQDKATDLEDFVDILEEMTVFKAPEGLSDSGSFELKPEYLADVDPYTAHYNKNQRDEAEHAYRTWMARRIGKPEEEIVLEPKLRSIPSGVFADLAAFTKTPLFAQIIFYTLAHHLHPAMSVETPSTRIEAYLQVVLHLVLAAVNEDDTYEGLEIGYPLPSPSFVYNILQKPSELGNTILEVLIKMLENEDIKGCHAKIRLILHRIQQRRPRTFVTAATSLFPKESVQSALRLSDLGFESPRTPPEGDQESKERQVKELRKKQALERQARVMAQFQRQQQNFLDNQNIAEWVDDDADVDSMITGISEEPKKTWKYPSGNCILCQEETNDSRLFGTFALMTNSSIFRRTDVHDEDYLGEVLCTPFSLDRAADGLRPFGVAAQNRKQVSKRSSDGGEIIAEYQGLGKGFPPSHTTTGPVSVGCGHIMHYSCFDLYCTSTQRRQNHQIARNHPEIIDRKEFVCPLCKALGNTFLPIIWKGKEETYPGALATETDFDEWLSSGVALTVSRFFKREEGRAGGFHHEQFLEYTSKTVIAPLARKISSSTKTPIMSPTSPQEWSRNISLGRASLDDSLIQALASPVNPATSDILMVDELMSIYNRVRETMRVNDLPSRFASASDHPSRVVEDLGNTDTLAKALGHSIAATEIAQRGTSSDPGHVLLDKIPTSVLNNLRILSETASSYIAIGGIRNHGSNNPTFEYSQIIRQQLLQLFPGNPQISGDDAEHVIRDRSPPALSQDSFVFLAECCISLVPAFNLDVHHVIRLCYLLEITKVTLYATASLESFEACQSPDNLRSISPIPRESLGAFYNFMMRIHMLSSPCWPINTHGSTPASGSGPVCDSPEILTLVYKAAATSALTFLRKTAILLNVRYGVIYPDHGFSDMEQPELERLTRILNLPSLSDVFAGIGSPAFKGSRVQESMISGWIQHWQWYEGHRSLWPPSQSKTEKDQISILKSSAYRSLKPEHPAIFELVGLPKQFDTLIYEATRRCCPTTGNRLEDPALCLFCAEMFCSQASCCQKGKKGGCNQHMQR